MLESGSAFIFSRNGAGPLQARIVNADNPFDPKYRDRALRFRVDEHGLEELEIDRQRSQMSRRGFPSTLGAMGYPDLGELHPPPAKDRVVFPRQEVLDRTAALQLEQAELPVDVGNHSSTMATFDRIWSRRSSEVIDSASAR